MVRGDGTVAVALPGCNSLCRNSFAKRPSARHPDAVTQPLALIFYQKLLPGSTLANRLRDLNYRVHAAKDPGELVAVAQDEGPMVVLVDVSGEGDEICDAVRRLRSNDKTVHVPVLAFADDERRQELARAAGATMAAGDAALNTHFEQLLEQVLRLD